MLEGASKTCLLLLLALDASLLVVSYLVTKLALHGLVELLIESHDPHLLL